jgi:hypothetical protein
LIIKTLVFQTVEDGLEGLLGPRLRVERIETPFGAGGIEKFGVYATPKLYLGNIPFMTGRTVLVGPLIGGSNCPYKAVLGMDCLRHYCIQIDFDEHKMRFLDSNTLKRKELGLAFPLSFTTQLKGVPLVDIKWPTNRNVRLMVDTGMETTIDFCLPPAAIQPAFQSHAAVDTFTAMGSPGGGWVEIYQLSAVVLGSETYRNVRVVQGEIAGGVIDGFLALPFLARHKVTFDFPNRTMYLRQRRAETGRESFSPDFPNKFPNRKLATCAGAA